MWHLLCQLDNSMRRHDQQMDLGGMRVSSDVYRST